MSAVKRQQQYNASQHSPEIGRNVPKSKIVVLLKSFCRSIPQWYALRSRCAMPAPWSAWAGQQPARHHSDLLLADAPMLDEVVREGPALENLHGKAQSESAWCSVPNPVV